MLKNNVWGGSIVENLDTKMREQFIAYLDRTKESNRRRAITGFHGVLARQGAMTLLDYTTAHEPDLVGIFEGEHIQHIARTAEAMAA